MHVQIRNLYSKPTLPGPYYIGIPASLNILHFTLTGGSPDILLTSRGSYSTGHSGCVGDLMFGVNSTTTSFIPLEPVTGVQVTRCGSS